MSVVYLVRHAKALDRSAWSEPDQLRPLSEDGFRQAEALPGHLGEPELSRLVTSPYLRCVQTFEPLVETRDAQLEHVDWLVEGAPGGAALELLLELGTGAPVAACTHGDVLLDILALLDAAQVRLEGALECKKGATWILEIGEGAVVSGRYLAPPDAPRE